MSAQKHEVDQQLDNRRAERAFMKAYGSANQYERLVVGLLPQDEMLALARQHLFGAFSAFRRWVKIEAGDIRHERDCNGGTIEFSTAKPGSLTHDEWSTYKQLALAVDAANADISGALMHDNVVAVISMVEHVGRCTVCKAETFGRAANIRIEWAGHPLSREYTLEAH